MAELDAGDAEHAAIACHMHMLISMYSLAPRLSVRPQRATSLLCSGGLMFGWNALALALKGQGIYSGGCDTELTGMHALFCFCLIQWVFGHQQSMHSKTSN